MRRVVVCSECRNVYVLTNEGERCPFCVGPPGGVILELLETEAEPLPSGSSQEGKRAKKRKPRKREETKEGD